MTSTTNEPLVEGSGAAARAALVNIRNAMNGFLSGGDYSIPTVRDLVSGIMLALDGKPDARNVPADWRVIEVKPGTPYPDEPSETMEPGVFLCGGWSDDPEDGAGLILKVHQAGEESGFTLTTLAGAIAARLNRRADDIEGGGE